LVLDKLHECDKEAPRVWAMHNQTLH
jgi:hypothetical protein